MATSPESTSGLKRNIFTSPRSHSSATTTATATPREQTPDRSNSTPPASRLRSGGGFRALARGIMNMQSLASGAAARRLARKDSADSLKSTSSKTPHHSTHRHHGHRRGKRHHATAE
ncbi:Hypp237 [Branchiostoma lanceolatum]|uniref:Hypp237 protein n=2 Tax=Branchiostoma lanceolatum TaxID=7740 RepID=A0A8J9YMS6_BRALA|nr:Hypp237 [Branchiostoma lanceolatum]